MLGYIWGGMILIGIAVAAFNGTMEEVSNSIIDSSKDAVSLMITMLGIISMWMGLMKVAEKSGLIDYLSRKMMPLLVFLFPDLRRNNKALNYISTNMIANVLGLGWAATPAGLLAMEEMQKVNKNKDTASRSMCTFLIINLSSLQLVTINIIAFRAEYNSINPAEIIFPGILATIISTAVGVIFAKVMGAIER